MKKFLGLSIAAVAALTALPSQAASLLSDSTATFDATTLTGTLIASSEFTGSALTFTASFRSAVYRNADGRLDFVYQVAHLGAGTNGSNNRISGFTVAEFDGFTVNALRDGSNHDGAGPFTLPLNNINGTGFTSLARRGPDGVVVEADFRGLRNQDGTANDLVQGETSTSYIFRTNAFSFTGGTFGVIDGSTLQGVTFAPTVPEPATWAMMIGGFGMLGAAARRSRKANTVLA